MPDENQSKQNPISKLGAVVLCGGKSSRLGIDKSRLDFNGRTFLEQVVAQVRQVCSSVVVVGNNDLSCHRLPGDVLIARDEASDKGPLEGIRVGLKRLSMPSRAAETQPPDASNQVKQVGCEFAFVTSCDVPLLKSELVRFLFEQLEGHSAIVPVQEERIFGMTAIYRIQLHVEIANRIKAGSLRVSDLASALGARCIEAESLRAADSDLDSLTNINSVADYRELLERLELTCPADLAKSIGLV